MSLDKDVDPYGEMSDAEWFQLDMEQWWEQTKQDEAERQDTATPEPSPDKRDTVTLKSLF